MGDAAIRSKLADVRREAEGLLDALNLIEAATRDPAYLPKVLDSEAANLRQESTSFARLLASIRSLADRDPDAARELDGAVTSIENYWRRVERVWPVPDETGAAAKGEQVIEAAAEARKWLKKINLEIAKINVPDDLGAWIKAQKVMRRVNFHDLFERDLPDPEDRQEILNYLASAPETYADAFISAKTGDIYRTSADRKSVAVAYFIFAAIVAIGGLVLTGIALGNLLGFTPPDLQTVLVAYGAVVVGAIAHMAVDIWKATGTEGELFNELGLKGYLLWGYSRQGQISKALLLLPVGPLMMLGLGDMTPLTGLFVGYSFDSILDLALKRFEKTMATGKERVEKGLAAA